MSSGRIVFRHFVQVGVAMENIYHRIAIEKVNLLGTMCFMTAIHNSQFDRCVHRYGGHYKVSRFRCWDQWLAMGFAQLSYRESLRDIESYLHTQLDLKGSIPVQIHITDRKNTKSTGWMTLLGSRARSI